MIKQIVWLAALSIPLACVAQDVPAFTDQLLQKPSRETTPHSVQSPTTTSTAEARRLTTEPPRLFA